MALLRDVVYKHGPKLTKFIKLETDKINLKPLKSILIKFDPFSENARNIREFSFFLHSQKVLQTNLRCSVKTVILTDRSESSATFSLSNGQDIVFKCDNLSCLEILKLYNKYITSLVSETEVSVAPVVKQKRGKKK